VLAGLRKYVQQGKVLLAGKPGSGKSTVLQRFRWEWASEALEEGDRPIPVLVELRSDRSILEAICAEFRQAKLRVCREEVEDLLFDGRLLLLLDGVNEMPSQQRRQELQLFHDDNPDTPMIFTTRDLALGGSLGIEKQAGDVRADATADAGVCVQAFAATWGFAAATIARSPARDCRNAVTAGNDV
jgi:hypothetical protein